MNEKKNELRIHIRSLYSHQKLRVSTGNRIFASFRTKLGLQSSESEDGLPEDAETMLKILRLEYKRITDGITKLTTKIKTDSTILTSYSEIQLIAAYNHQLDAENIHEKAVLYLLENMEIGQWLLSICGIGPLMAGVIVAEFDIHKAETVSALWKYSGLDVVNFFDADGNLERSEGRCRKKDHLVPKTYTNTAGEITETIGISFNDFLKTKLVGVLAVSFIRQKNSAYRQIYLDYKSRLENHPKHKDKTPKHRDNMARRYMIKIFLKDLYVQWRTIEGLPVRPSYEEAKLGIVHSKSIDNTKPINVTENNLL